MSLGSFARLGAEFCVVREVGIPLRVAELLMDFGIYGIYGICGKCWGHSPPLEVSREPLDLALTALNWFQGGDQCWAQVWTFFPASVTPGFPKSQREALKGWDFSGFSPLQVVLGGGQEAMDVTTTSTRIGKFEARLV